MGWEEMPISPLSTSVPSAVAGLSRAFGVCGGVFGWGWMGWMASAWDPEVRVLGEANSELGIGNQTNGTFANMSRRRSGVDVDLTLLKRVDLRQSVKYSWLE